MHHFYERDVTASITSSNLVRQGSNPCARAISSEINRLYRLSFSGEIITMVISFRTFLQSSDRHDSRAEHRSIQFLQHLFSPIGTVHHGVAKAYVKEEHELEEVTIYNNKPAATSTNPTAAPLGKHLPKSQAMIDLGNRELPEGNLHKRIHQGVHAAYSAMASEDFGTRKKKARESRRVLDDFARSRGLKGGMPDLLRENGKMEKSTGEKVWTKGLSLAPHAASGLGGFDVCPRASSECRANCLGTTAGGNKQYPDTALSAKIVRTHALAMHPEHFARVMDDEIGKHTRAAAKKGMRAGVRLNVTSDLPWEKYHPGVFGHHPDTEFYDYTKMHQRVANQGKPDHPSNYRLALSHTGADHEESNDHHVAKALASGHVVAMVHQRGAVTPTHVEDVKTGQRYPVVNGDNDDHLPSRHTQAGRVHGAPGQGVVSILKLKGVKNEAAGAFANKVDDDGVIRINGGNHAGKKD